jgi:hypothetical protein
MRVKVRLYAFSVLADNTLDCLRVNDVRMGATRKLMPALVSFKAVGVEITKAAPISAGTTEQISWVGQSSPLPADCRVGGVINRRTGVGGEEFGNNFALAMPDKWNGGFLMQGEAAATALYSHPSASTPLEAHLD